MRTFLQDGRVFDYTNPTTNSLSSGAVVRVQTGTAAASGVVGIVRDDIAGSGVGAILVDGVIRETRVHHGAWTQGAPIFWDSVNSVFTATSTDTYAGRAAAAKATNAATGDVALNFK